MTPGSYIISYLEGDNLIGVEIGVWTGRSLISDLNEHRIKKMYAIDPYIPYGMTEKKWTQKQWDDRYESVKKNISVFGNRVVLIRACSDDAVSLIPDRVDFVFIDGDHRYPQVMRDIKNYEPKVRKGGILCGHDYGDPRYPEVTEAVDDYALEFGRVFHPRSVGVNGWWCWER